MDTSSELRRAAEILGWELPTATGKRKDELVAAMKLLNEKADDFDRKYPRPDWT